MLGAPCEQLLKVVIAIPARIHTSHGVWRRGSSAQTTFGFHEMSWCGLSWTAAPSRSGACTCTVASCQTPTEISQTKYCTTSPFLLGLEENITGQLVPTLITRTVSWGVEGWGRERQGLGLSGGRCHYFFNTGGRNNAKILINTQFLNYKSIS